MMDSIYGYVCEKCGRWIPTGTYHVCVREWGTYDTANAQPQGDLIAILKRIEALLGKIERRL
jgi:hypothetical protein